MPVDSGPRDPEDICDLLDRFLAVDVVASDAGSLQGVDLMIGVLVSGRDARVAKEHASKIRHQPVSPS
jgi:hypothetical protein